jgi:hypothetical protein
MATCRLVSDERQHLDNVGGYPVQIELGTLQKGLGSCVLWVEASLSDQIDLLADRPVVLRVMRTMGSGIWRAPSRALGERIGSQEGPLGRSFISGIELNSGRL